MRLRKKTQEWMQHAGAWIRKTKGHKFNNENGIVKKASWHGHILTSLMDGFAKQNKLDEVVTLVSRMESLNVHPDVVTCTQSVEAQETKASKNETKKLMQPQTKKKDELVKKKSLMLQITSLIPRCIRFYFDGSERLLLVQHAPTPSSFSI
jgi:hypothetical protein